MRPAKLSRSKVELFVECPRCFYLDVVKKHPRPSGYPFTLNNAVDTLLKREFDIHRSNGTAHPIQLQAGLDLLPASHASLDLWRNAFAGGVSHHYAKHGIVYYGAIDDLWVNSHGVYAVVDYKATAKDAPVTELPAWATSYSRQLSFYQWLLRKNGLDVMRTAYLVYATASTAEPVLGNALRFDLRLIPVESDDLWVEPTLELLFECLQLLDVPAGSPECSYCRYWEFLKTDMAS